MRAIDPGTVMSIDGGTFKDLSVAAQILAAFESVQWIFENARGAPQFVDRNGVVDHALDELELAGVFAEFGCYTGSMTRYIRRRLPNAEYHAFDSFRGVPGHEPFAIAPGSFDLGGVAPALPDGVIVHAGWFDDTLPAWVIDALDSDVLLAFAYVDCDLFPAAHCVLDNIAPLLVDGSIVVFDDYYNFPNWREHSHKAVVLCSTKHGLEFEPIATSTRGHAVAFRITRRP